MPVKTRLIPLLGEQGAIDFYLKSLAWTITLAGDYCDLPLVATSPRDVDPATVLRDLPPCRTVAIEGDDGAVCLENALACCEPGEPIVALGADAPDLPFELVDAALRALEDHDAAFVPTPDGGFSCLALKKAVPGIADGFSYGGDDALVSLEGWMQERGLFSTRVEPWPDVDTPEDYKAWQNRAAKAGEESPELYDEGMALLEEGDLGGALRIARELERRCYSGGFEIAALALADLGDLERATATLARGVEKAPDAWINWQLLGNLRSDNEDFDGADAAYERALGCSDVWVASIRLNQSLVADRRGDREESLRLLELVDDPDLWLGVESRRIGMLIDEQEWDEALRRARDVIDRVGDDEPPSAVHFGFVLAAHARALHETGAPETEAIEAALHALAWDPHNEYTLWLLREIHGAYAEDTRLFRVMIEGRDADHDPPRFFVKYEVAASNGYEAFEYAAKLERWSGASDLSADETEDLGAEPELPKGVYFRGLRQAFERE
jgi:glycosyltransferase A (GT-A) superfamily protein (DUF2064 family)